MWRTTSTADGASLHMNLRGLACRALVLSSLALGCTAQKQENQPPIEAFEGHKTCKTTGLQSQGPGDAGALRFCQKHNWASCCTPAVDLENEEFYKKMINFGVNCQATYHVRQLPMASLYCMNCDEKQPKYIRPEPYTDPGWGDFTKHRPSTILVCKEWTQQSFYHDLNVHTYLEGRMKRLKQCGIKISSPCLGSDGVAINDRDRYMCGDDVIVPPAMFPPDVKPDDSKTLIEEAMRTSIEAFINYESVGPPELDDDYALLVVAKRPCENRELKEHYENKTKYLPFATDVDLENRENGPYCLRSKNQIEVEPFSLPWSKDGFKTTFLQKTTWQDFFCRGGTPLKNESESASDSWLYGGAANGMTCKDHKVHNTKLNKETKQDEYTPTYKANNACCEAEWEDEMCFSGTDAPRATLVIVAIHLLAVALLG